VAPGGARHVRALAVGRSERKIEMSVSKVPAGFKAAVLADIRRYRQLYPGAAPEVVAVGLIRGAGSLAEVRVILNALDEVLAEERTARG
jgi:hypothetical protein